MRFVDGSDRAESWMPKYDPDSGDVWITRWEDPTKTGVSENGKKVRLIESPKGSSYNWGLRWRFGFPVHKSSCLCDR